MTTCPMCAEDVATTDVVCPHCGNLLRAPASPPSIPTQTPVASRTVPPQPPTSRATQWIVPGVLAIAVVLVLLMKFAWWDRRWQGTPEACDAVSALTGLHPSTEERDESTRAYFAGSRQALLAFVADLAGTDTELVRTRGIPAAQIERLYVAAVGRTGVAEENARATFREHHTEILRAAGSELRGYQSSTQAAAWEAAAASCRSAGTSPAPSVSSGSSRVPAPAPTSARANTPTREALAAPLAPAPAAAPEPAPAPTTPPAAAPAAPQLERLTPTVVTASSFISNGHNQFAPERAFDGDLATTWTEAARGPGDGEWLQANFVGPQLVQRVRITTGWNHTSPRGEDLFTANSHLRRVRLVLGPRTSVERDVSADEREVVFDGLDAETATVRIEAVSVWSGTRWADLCIGEVSIEGESLANGPVAVPPAEESPRAAGDGSRPCTYATHDRFHLRASPTASRAGAVEITTNPVVELLRAERLRRGHERLFQVRLPDGREGWMFVTKTEVAEGCDR